MTSLDIKYISIMKTFRIGLSVLVVLIATFYFSCSDNDILSTKQTNPDQMGVSDGKVEALLAINPDRILPRSPITYIENFTGDVIWDDSFHTEHAYSNPELWDYYSFYARAGSSVDIYVKRLTCGMDPAFFLYSGTYSNTSDLSDYIGIWDDEVNHECCYGDPYLDNWVVPTSGYYTIAVWDNGSCTPAPFAYRLVITGITYTINIDDCDTDVEDYVFEDGDTMQSLIMSCAEDVSNHGEFVSCVSALTNKWKKEGLLTGEEKEVIMACAAEADIP